MPLGARSTLPKYSPVFTVGTSELELDRNQYWEDRMPESDQRNERELVEKQRNSSIAQVEPSHEKALSSGGQKGLLRRVVVIATYVVFLGAVVVGTLAGLEYYAYQKVKNSPLGQAYQGRDLDLARRSSQTVAPQYGYEPTPGFAAVRNTRLGNAYEYINSESFKDFEDVPSEKPDDEYRVIVTGGSVVYGRGPVPPADVVADFYEVTYRWTIPHIMEKLLDADPRIGELLKGKHVRVINAGVPGYVIQNNLMRYLAKLRLYRPDLVVALDGANEVHTVARPLRDWNYFTEGPYYEVISDIMDMSRGGLLNYVTLWLKRNTYFFTWLAMSKGEGPGILMENRGFAAHPQDPDEEMLAYRDRNISQVADVVAIYHKVLETDKVPHVFALQPMFRNSKKKRTPMEEKIESVTGMQKIGFYDAAQTYELLVDKIKKRCAAEGFEVYDLTGIFDDVTEWVFTDWCHLTNGANYVMAKALVNRIKTSIFNLPLLESDVLHKPTDSYFIDYACNAKVYVGEKPANQGLHILKGYPSTEKLEVDPASLSSASGLSRGVVLDIGRVVPISRLRIVWGGPNSVPPQWAIDFSEDGANWKAWLTAKDIAVDHFDQWPGYEYYAPCEEKARFVRYRAGSQEKTDPIVLRQISLYR